METIGSYASAIESLAHQLIAIADSEKERKQRKTILGEMFAGNSALLEEGYSFEEMFRAFDEHIVDKRISGIVLRMSDNVKHFRGRKRRLL